MTSPFANFILALQAALQAPLAPFVPSGSELIVDLDTGQLDHHERPMVTFPCVLIDFPDWIAEDASKGGQTVSGHIVLKIVAAQYTSTSSITPTEYLEAGLSVFEMEQAVYEAIHNRRISLTADNSACSAPLSRIRARTDGRRPGLKVREVTYKCSYTDYSAVPTTGAIPLPPLTITESLSFPT